MTDFNLPDRIIGFEPGDLAQVFLQGEGWINAICNADRTGWVWVSRGVGRGSNHRPANVAHFRGLQVRRVLPVAKDSEELTALVRGFFHGTPATDTTLEAVRVRLSRSLDRALEPKMQEPGTWGVVKAGCVHNASVRQEWVRYSDGNWYPIAAPNPEDPDDWNSLVDPELVRPGLGAP